MSQSWFLPLNSTIFGISHKNSFNVFASCILYYLHHHPYCKQNIAKKEIKMIPHGVVV